MNETSKAMRRRRAEESETGFPWKKIFTGKGVDIGSGGDKLPFDECEPFDQEQGDANHILAYLPSGAFDYVHCSHVLEHVIDPQKALSDWIQLLKPGGYLVGEVPSWELYEGKRPKSIFNPDHKSTWSMWNKKGGGALTHYCAPDFFDLFVVKTISLRLIDTNYNYQIGASIDQTFRESDGVECYIEFVLQKI